MQEKTLKLNGLTIAYQEYNYSKKDLPIIFLHGWLDNSASFNSLIPKLNKHRCIAVDLPGHGYSEHIASHAYYHFIDGISHIIEMIF